MLISTKLPNPIRETRVPKLVFMTITCLKFWAQDSRLETGVGSLGRKTVYNKGKEKGGAG